jgi:hypothetical protein
MPSRCCAPGQTTPAFVKQRARVLRCRHARLGRHAVVRAGVELAPAFRGGASVSAQGMGELPSKTGSHPTHRACIRRCGPRRRPNALHTPDTVSRQTSGLEISRALLAKSRLRIVAVGQSRGVGEKSNDGSGAVVERVATWLSSVRPAASPHGSLELSTTNSRHGGFARQPPSNAITAT